MVTYSKVEFGVIPQDHWNQPDWIDEDKATKARKEMEENNVIYGGAPHSAVNIQSSECAYADSGSLSYRNMCRFNSGFFYRHELMQKYRFYWRVE